MHEKVIEIRQNFAKAVTAGTRIRSGRIVHEFSDDLVSVSGDLPQQSHFLLECRQITFTVQSTASSPTEIEDQENDIGTDMCLIDGLDKGKDLEELESRLDSSIVTSSLTPKAKEDTRKRSSSHVQLLIDNKRKHLEKTPSVAQRDQVLMNDAGEDKKLRKDLAQSIQQSSVSFNITIQNMSDSVTQLGNNICRSIEMLSQAMLLS